MDKLTDPNAILLMGRKLPTPPSSFAVLTSIVAAIKRS